MSYGFFILAEYERKNGNISKEISYLKKVMSLLLIIKKKFIKRP